MNSIAVFARWPRMGTVKTRLTPALPAALSLALHRAMLADTLAVARATAAERRILYWGDAPDAVDAGVDPAADPPGFETRHQRGADLGARMSIAFEELLAAGTDRAVLVGTDCPDLGPAGIGAFGHSFAYGAGGGQQVGYAYVGSHYRASLWSGTAASWVDLDPAGSSESAAFGVGGGRQAGYAILGGVQPSRRAE